MFRWAWYLLLGLFAGCAAIVQIDRHSIEMPWLTGLVPDSLASFALTRKAAGDLGDGRPQRALWRARRLVWLHPVPAENLTVLAVAELAAGHQTNSSSAIMLSAQRGWREPMAQRSIALAAAAGGQWEIAADRLTALWKTSPASDNVRELSEELLQHSEVRTKLAARLDGESDWTRAFLIWSQENLPPRAVVNMIDDAVADGVKFPCNNITSYSRVLLARGEAALADGVWGVQCGVHRKLAKSDFAFIVLHSNSGAAEDPYAWRFPDVAGLVRTFDDGSEQGALTVQNSDPLRRVFAKKYLALRPGKHTLHARLNDLSQMAGSPARFALYCRSPVSSSIKLIDAPINKSETKIQIPDQNCSAQELILTISQGRADGLLIDFD